MRKVMFAAALACGTAACAQGGDRSSLTSAAGPPAESESIVVGEQSNICVSVYVDQRIWPTPLDAETARGFTTGFASEMSRLHVERGRSHYLPHTQSEARFVSNLAGGNPLCRESEADLFVELRYRPRTNGGPFTMDYRIGRAAAVLRTGVVERDVAEELRTGRIVGGPRQRRINNVIYDDIRARAAMILDLMIIER